MTQEAAPKLIALVDGSVYSRSVCDHAAWVAGRIKADVEILHILGRRRLARTQSNLSGNIGLGARSTLLQELAEYDVQRSKLANEKGRAILEDAKAILLEANAGEVTTRLRNDDVISTVEELEDETDLVIIGKRGEAADFAKLHLGSNLERVVRASKKPILVASRAFQPIERFMLAFDGGASANKALEHILRSRMFPGLECHILSVGEPGGQADIRLNEAAERLRGAGYAVTATLAQGQPDMVITEAVERQKIGLLVMGAYGHSRIRSLIIGSTTSEMLRSCRIPVMLFR